MTQNYYHNIYLMYFIFHAERKVKTITDYGVFCNCLLYFKVIGYQEFKFAPLSKGTNFK